MRRIPKPRHLEAEYGAQFKDRSVAAAYMNRPPYPAEVFDVLESLVVGEPRVVLDLGSGTGELTIPLASRLDRVDGVDQSEAMLEMAKTRPGWDRGNIRWIRHTAEDFKYDEQYGLIVAGVSLHWMDWYAVLPRMARSMSEDAFLAIVGGREEVNFPWQEELKVLYSRYSTNRDFEPYNFIDELTQRSLFEVVGRKQTAPVTHRQAVDDYIEKIHSRNGFSRERMTAESAAAFDSEVRAALAPHVNDGVVAFDVVTTITWGRPLD